MRVPAPIAAVTDRLTGAGTRRDVAALREDLGVALNNNELLAESVADLERGLYEPGWIRALAIAELEFAPEALVQMRAICRLFALKNPLIKRGLLLRSAYVWGGGVEVTARANGRGHDGEQDVQGVIAAFLADPGNQRAVTGPEAADQLERSGLGTEGEVFITCFTRPRTGEVQVRTIPPDEIVDIISNPEDASEPWFYWRRWNKSTINYEQGTTTTQVVEAVYPCIDYRPAGTRPNRIGKVKIEWSAPVLHVAVNRPRGWQRGIPDSYAAIDWSKAYTEFLTDWARLMKSLSRYAWKATTKGSAAAQVRARIAQAPSRSDVTGEPLAAGATALLSPDAALEAINKSGATIDAESGRPLAMMVASALGVPVTMLLADPGQTGARATAETLDQPTELEMGQRRKLWESAYRRLCTYVVVEAVRAPEGALKGVLRRDAYGRETLALAGDTAVDVDIVWPDLDDTDVAQAVEAIVKAAGTGVIPPEQVLRLLLAALGVRNVDVLVEAMLDEDGSFVWPTGPPLGIGGDAANRERNGLDPADAGPGSMTPDGEDEPDDPVVDEPDDVEPDEQPV
jgi:hypothetical protein